MSLDGQGLAADCQPCARKYRIKVVERVVPASNPWRPNCDGLVCDQCGRPLPHLLVEGPWVRWVLRCKPGEDGQLVPMCTLCRMLEGCETALTTRTDEP